MVSPIVAGSQIKTNFKNRVDGLTLLHSILPNKIKTAFFDPQYRGVLDKLQYGNEGRRKRHVYRGGRTDGSVLEHGRGYDHHFGKGKSGSTP